MIAQIIPFDRASVGTAQTSAEDAWEQFHIAAREMQRLYEDPESTPKQRMNACMRAIRLHRIFAAAMEAM